MWILQVLGDITSDTREYELSVIKKDAPAGRKSWGWGCENKIILFSSGVGGNGFNPRTPEKVEFAMGVAEGLRDLLNSTETPGEAPEETRNCLDCRGTGLDLDSSDPDAGCKSCGGSGRIPV